MRNQLIAICENDCTDCKACISVCPIQCIREKRNDDGRVVLAIDEKKCIGCNKCKKICPQLSLPEMNYPIKAYAAWSNDENEKRISASGGVASAMYRYAISNGWPFTGAYYDAKEYRVKLDIGSNLSDIDKFRNSKYTHSDAGNIYKRCQKLIENGKNVIFVGLPCQIAAMRKIEHHRENIGQIFYVDLVCHGTPPEEYLKNHIEFLEKTMGEKTKQCLFRNPEFDTSNFVFSLISNEGKTFYSKGVVSDDYYQLGFHRAVTYRSNCYSCKFARPERCGDITLGDYKGLGILDKYEGNRKDVSCVLVNTKQGEKLIEMLALDGYIIAKPRPVQEPIKSDHQLNAPSVRHKARGKFILRYTENGNFEEAASEAIKSLVKWELFMEKLHVKKWMLFAKKISPMNVIRAVRRRIK